MTESAAKQQRCYTLQDYAAYRLSSGGARTAPTFGQSRDEFDAWKRKFVERWISALGKLPVEVPLNPQVLQSIRLPQTAGGGSGSIRAEKIVFDSSPGMSVPAWMLIPEKEKAAATAQRPRPAVLLIAGHSGAIDPTGPGKIVDRSTGKAWVAGLDPDGNACSTHYHNDIGQKLASAGFVVLCPDMLGFGERASDPHWARNRWTHVCDLHAAALRWLSELELPAVHWFDFRRCIDYLLTRADVVDPDRISVMGCSLGGTWSTYLAMTDPRIKSAMISASYADHHGRLAGKKCNLCAAQMAPGQLEFDDGAVSLCAIAPKPIMIQIGRNDPMASDQAIAIANRVKSVYEQFGWSDRCMVHLFDGGHEIDVSAAVEWAVASGV